MAETERDSATTLRAGTVLIAGLRRRVRCRVALSLVLRREKFVDEIHERSRHALVHLERDLPEVLAVRARQDAEPTMRQ